MSPIERDAFTSQNQNMLYESEALGMQQQLYTQQFMPMPQYRPLQFPDEINENTTNIAVIGPTTQSLADPPPRLSNNPAVVTMTLFKELTAYPNYGNPSKNADILYTGNRGSWSFESPAFLFVPGNLRTQIIIRAALDDHANVPVNRYSLRIIINGNVVHDGRVPLEHGVHAGGMFTNWREIPFNISNMRRTTQVTIENTSTANADDWIAFDWMQIRFLPR